MSKHPRNPKRFWCRTPLWLVAALGCLLVPCTFVLLAADRPGHVKPTSAMLLQEQQAKVGKSPASITRAAVAEPTQQPAKSAIDAGLVVRAPQSVELCQCLGPAAPHPISGVDCATGNCGELGWSAMGPINFQQYAQGEYVGMARTAHVPEYRLRVGDQIDVVYRITRDQLRQPYELNIGDEVQLESSTDADLNRNVMIQPDGMITLKLLGQVPAYRKTIEQLTRDIEAAYKQFYDQPAVTVTPLRMNTKLTDVVNTVDSRQGFGGQFRTVIVTPDGTIQLPAIGSVPAQGLTFDELRNEIDARYATITPGIGVTPVLKQRAARYVFVLGEVKTPGRYTLEGPTTVMMALSMAGGQNVGSNLRQIVVFRRGDDWRLMATMLDLRGAVYGKQPCPADEIWVNDSDIIIVPKSPVLIMNNWIELVFTKGLYGVAPFSLSYSWFNQPTVF